MMSGKNPMALLSHKLTLVADKSQYLSFLGEVNDAGKVVDDGGDVFNISLILGQFLFMFIGR